VQRQWPRLGTQGLPQRLVLADALAVAQAVGEGPRWLRARERVRQLLQPWPMLAGRAVLGRLFDVWADYEPADFRRLLGLLQWARSHPASGLYLRQLPVPGLHTKWIAARSRPVTELLRALQGAADPGLSDADAAAPVANLHGLLGLRQAPARVRVRLLCPALQARLGGLQDIEAPVQELARLPIEPRAVLIVENLETGLALPTWPGVVAVMKLGAAVKLVAGIGWLVRAPCWYWGDIDTHGFDILQRARSVLPGLRSVLMDTTTLLTHRDLCVSEPSPSGATELALLDAAEREVCEGLRTDRWGPALRLEQERIDWDTALAVLGRCLVSPG
jgi:hypothetical protein